LQASVDLLPTALAVNELGTLALQANNRVAAKQYFEMAASAPGALGEQARNSFLQLDVPDNPATYVQAQVFAASDGRIIIRVANRAPVTLTQVALELQAVVGRDRTRRPVAVQNLQSGQVRDIDSGVRLSGGSTLETIQAQVVVRGAAIN
jgi:beta-barrel assembly-enhancing protease